MRQHWRRPRESCWEAGSRKWRAHHSGTQPAARHPLRTDSAADTGSRGIPNRGRRVFTQITQTAQQRRTFKHGSLPAFRANYADERVVSEELLGVLPTRVVLPDGNRALMTIIGDGHQTL